MSVFWNMLETYWAPSRVAERIKDGSEPRAFAYLLGAVAWLFIAELPKLSRRTATSPQNISFEEFFWGSFAASIFFFPLIFYSIAFICFWAMRLFGYKGESLIVRLHLFWCLFAIGPALIVYSGVVAVFERSTLVDLLGCVGLFWFLGLCIFSFRTRKT